MWPFKRHYSPKDSRIFEGFTDWHSHILPGVDDGVQTMEESLEILRLYEQLGVKALWLTPHIMEDIPNTTADLQKHFTRLQALYQGPVQLYLSAEYMLDNLFLERLERNDLLPHAGNRLLIETSYFSAPMRLEKTFDEIRSKGYFPVLAHPERYNYMGNKNYQRLKQSGEIHFQLNLFSLFGEYGPTVRQKAEYLVEQNFYQYLGTDLHRLETLDRILFYKASGKTIDRLKQMKKNEHTILT